MDHSMQSGSHEKDNLFSTLFSSLIKFIYSPTWIDAQQHVRDHTELLGDEISLFLGTLLINARNNGEHAIADLFELNLQVLTRCGEVGIDQAFAEILIKLRLPREIASATIEAFEKMPSDNRAEIVHIFASTQNPDELQNAFASRPDLMKTLDEALTKVAADAMPQSIPSEFQYGLAELMKAEELFLETGNVAALERYTNAIKHIITHPNFVSAPDVFRISMLSVAVAVFSDRYATWKREEDLDQLLSICKLALSLPSQDQAQRAMFLYNMGTGFRKKNLIVKNLEALNQAIECLEEAVTLTPDESPDQPDHLVNLGAVYADRYKLTDNLTDTQHAILSWEHAMDLVPHGSKNWIESLNNLAVILSDRFTQTRKFEDLDRAIESFQQLVILPSIDSISRDNYLNAMCSALFHRYQEMNDIKSLEHSIEGCQQAVDLMQLDSPNRASLLTTFGNALHERYLRTNIVSDLDQAISKLQEAVQLTQPSSLEKVIRLDTLGNIFLDRYNYSGDLSDLEKTLALFTELAELTSYQNGSVLINLAVAFRERYSRTSNPNDLEQAIKLLQDAMKLSTLDVSERARALDAIGTLMSDSYLISGDLTILEKSISNHRKAAEIVSFDATLQSQYLYNLGNELSRVYDRIGDLSELDEAIDTYETVVQIDPTKSNLHGHILNALGGALRERYGRTGRVSDLEQAISNFRQAIQITPSNWVERCGRLNNLGNALRDLYAYTRDLSDITEAIDFCEQALQLTPMDSPIYPRHLTNFGLALEDCCNDKKDISYLKRAILSFEEAIQATALDSPERVDRLNSLGNGFSTLYSYTDNQDDLNRALGAFEEALNFALPESEERARTLNNSTAVLEKLYNRTNDITKLSQAIARIEEAIQITPKNSIQLARRLNNLANLLILRFAQIGDQTDKERAVESWRQACQVGLDVSMEIVLTASSSWLDAILSYHHWQEAIEASKYALQATEHLFRVQLLRTSKEAWLKEASGLHAKAAYALSRQGDFPSALLTLEGGRARLLADIIERQRSDLKKLKEMGYEDVYDLYSSTTQKLGVLENAEISEKDSPKHIDLRTEIFNARADLDKAIELIRKIDGYEDFFKSSTFERVKHDLLDKETSAGIYLLTTSIGGLGLIVHSNGVEAVWLEDFGESDLDALLIKSEEGKPTGGYLLGQFGYGSFEALNELLPVLGEQAIAPIAERLRQIGITKIVLIPTGRLALLPLHAAQYNHKGSDMCLLDEFEVTYAASARVLGIARQKLTSQQNTPPVLTGVGNPLKNPRPLTYARPELEEIGNFFANDARYLFFEQDATKEALFTASSNAKYIHFSCHGMFDLFNPLSSHLQLAKGDTLTLREVMNSKKFENARLVVLSACQTAITDFNKLPDETIGLPMGFFQAGVPGVVGTLWPVDDLSTMLLMIKLYEKHIREGKAPVVSLCEAQLWLRRVTNTELSKLFAEYKAGALNHASTRIAYELAREKFREHTLGNPNERPYEHPYFWAPFVFYGT